MCKMIQKIYQYSECSAHRACAATAVLSAVSCKPNRRSAKSESKYQRYHSPSGIATLFGRVLPLLSRLNMGIIAAPVCRFQIVRRGQHGSIVTKKRESPQRKPEPAVHPPSKNNCGSSGDTPLSRCTLRQKAGIMLALQSPASSATSTRISKTRKTRLAIVETCRHSSASAAANFGSVIAGSLKFLLVAITRDEKCPDQKYPNSQVPISQ